MRKSVLFKILSSATISCPNEVMEPPFQHFWPNGQAVVYLHSQSPGLLFKKPPPPTRNLSSKSLSWVTAAVPQPPNCSSPVYITSFTSSPLIQQRVPRSPARRGVHRPAWRWSTYIHSPSFICSQNQLYSTPYTPCSCVCAGCDGGGAGESEELYKVIDI